MAAATTLRPATPGLLVVGHGTRSEVGTRQFLELAARLADRVAPVPVEACFLEIQQPDIAATVRRLLDRGARHVTVVPLLLFAAGHAKRDIPEAVAAGVGAWTQQIATPSGPPPIEISFAEHLGCHPALVALSRRRWDQALANQPPVPAERTCLLLVGRGSRDDAATAEMHVFAGQRHDARLAATTQVAFLAMARPSLAETLPQIAARGLKRVIVQPHLLFEGDLADTLRHSVSQIAAAHPHTQWLVAPLLADPPGACGAGTDQLLDALVERIAAA